MDAPKHVLVTALSYQFEVYKLTEKRKKTASKFLERLHVRIVCLRIFQSNFQTMIMESHYTPQAITKLLTAEML